MLQSGSGCNHKTLKPAKILHAFAGLGFSGSRNGFFPSQHSFFPGFGFSVPAAGFFQFPLVFSVPVVGVFGSRLNTVFLVPTFGCFQFPFFFLAVLVCYGCVSFRPFPSWVFSVPGGRAQRLPARCIADSDDGGLCFEFVVVVVVVVVVLVVHCCFGYCG